MNEKRKIELKGLIGIVTIIAMLISYMIVVYNLTIYNIMYHALYDISTGLGISILTGILFTFFANKWLKMIVLFCCAFYGSSGIIQLLNLIPSLSDIPLKYSSIFSIFTILIYWAYDRYFNNSRNIG